MEKPTFILCEQLKNHVISQEYISIMLILDTPATLLIDDHTWEFKNPTAILTGCPNDIELKKPEDIANSYMVQINTINCGINFENLYLNNIMPGYFNNIYMLDLNESDDLFQIDGTLNEIIKETLTKDSMSNYMIKILVERFLIKFIRIYNHNSVRTFEQKRISDFIILVNKHFKELHKLSDYAKLMHMSTKSLSNIFTASSDLTPATIIKDRIIKEALTMLRNYPGISGKEVAFELGYTNPNNFFVLFRNKTGKNFSSLVR